MIIRGGGKNSPAEMELSADITASSFHPISSHLCIPALPSFLFPYIFLTILPDQRWKCTHWGSLSFHFTLPTCVFTPSSPALPSSSKGVLQPADSLQEIITRAREFLSPNQAVFESIYLPFGGNRGVTTCFLFIIQNYSNHCIALFSFPPHSLHTSVTISLSFTQL